MMGMRKAIVVALGALALSACSEQPQVVQYQQGQYSGKADTRPWEAAGFNGDKAAWEKQIRERGRSQSEYNRIQ